MASQKMAKGAKALLILLRKLDANGQIALVLSGV